MDEQTKKNVAKVALFAGLAWISYKLVKGVAKKQSPSTVVKETIKPAVDTAKEAVAAVAHPVETVTHPIKAVKKIATPAQIAAREAFSIMVKKKAADRKAGKTITPDQKPSDTHSMVQNLRSTGHKGHSTKKGLSQDQKRVSKEDWEESYQGKIRP